MDFSIYSIIQFFIVLGFLGHVLTIKKSSTSTLAWLLIILIQPYIGLPLYLLFGSRKIVRKKPLIFPTSKLSTIHDPVQKILVASGSPMPCHNAKMDFLENGQIAYETLISIIESAKKYIYLETFIFSNDKVGHLVLESLTKKAQSGVDVRILLDSLGSIMPGHPSFKPFIKAGGKLSMFMPLIHKPFQGSANLRNHRKLVVVDDEISMIGGMNIAEEYMGPTPKENRWVDLAMTIQGPLVFHIKDLFLFDWAFATKTEAKITPKDAFISDDDKHLAQLVMSGPDIQTDPIYELLLTAIYSAKKRIWMTTPYFVPDEALAKALELAARRGVDVRLVIPHHSNHPVADFARQSYLEQIHTAGAKIYLYPKMIHAKLTLIDDQYAFIGSANMDSRSLLLNYELGVCLYSTNDIKKLETWCEGVFERSSTEIEPLTHAHKWFGRMARLVSPLL